MASLPPEIQSRFRAEQRAIQRQLDAQGAEAGAVQVPRPAGLAALASRIGDTNVVSFPLAPRGRTPWPGPAGDAA